MCCASYKEWHILESEGNRVFKQATYHSAEVYMRLAQDVTAGPKGTRRTAAGWSDKNDQDGRTQLISDTEMFNGVKVLL